jgi:hypothetical protein
MNNMLHIQHINTNSLTQATTTKQLHHKKLELLCDELNNRALLRHGKALQTDVIPNILEAERYTCYIMPEGGAYVYDVTSLPPLLIDDIVADLLQHMDTAQGELLHREQVQRMRALKHTAYVRQMKLYEITESSSPLLQFGTMFTGR